MLSRIRKSMEKRDEGFTLIELLVVIIIIGILAAIAIPVFLNQRQNGYKATVKSDLKNLATAVESYAADHEGSYTGAALATVEFNESGSVDDIEINVSPDGTSYCLEAQHDNLAVAWSYTKTDGIPKEGACP